MKKVLQGFLAALLLTVIACNKNKDTVIPEALPAQTWVFDSVTYNTVECYADTVHNNLNISANNGSVTDSTNYCALTCFFYGAALPAANGTYSVALVNTPTGSITSNQVTLRLVRGGSFNTYMSTGGDGHQTVSVTVSNGKITISGTNIEMAHYNSTLVTDSTALSFNITQTQ